MVTESFSLKLNKISKDLGMNPRDLLLVMFLESGVTPTAINPSGATGLIQFMPPTLKGMGLSDREVKSFGKRSAEDQLDYVKRHVQSHRGLIGGQPFTSATQYYVANFFPIALHRWHGTDPIRNANVPVVHKNSKDSREVDAYKSNQGLDSNHDGVITVGDLTNVLMRKEKTPEFQHIMRQFNSVAGSGSVSERHMKKNIRKAPESKSMITMFLNKLTNFMDTLNIAASRRSHINKYGSEYPNNKFLITIDSDNDFSSKLEFARILSLALKEEIDAESETYTDGNNIEVQCIVSAEQERGLKVIKEFCAALSDTFETATKKIGGVKIYPFINVNENSCYQKLDIKLSDINYRKFHLKFIK